MRKDTHDALEKLANDSQFDGAEVRSQIKAILTTDATTTESPEPELLAFVHITPGAYPDVEDPCGHTFEQHEWDYEGAGSCNGERSKRYEWESDYDEPFRCGCTRSPDQIEIEYLRSRL